MHNLRKYNHVQHFICLHMYLTSCQKTHKILEGVKIGKTFAKWGNLDENLLNRVISVKN
jgi:hypothetical protein